MPISSTALSSIANMGRTYSQIAHTTLATTSATVTFTNIPSTYTDLIISLAHVQFVDTSSFIRFNSDTSANYAYRGFFYNDTTTQELGINYGVWASNGASQTSQLTSFVHIMNYASTSTWKTTLTRYSAQNANYGGLVCATWRSTSPIDSLIIRSGSDNFKVGSKFSVFGIKKA